LAAREQLRPDVARKRELFAIARRFVDADRFVWLDESAARCHMTRLYGWSEGGSRCVDFTPAGHWKNQTMLAAMRSSGVVAAASLLADEPMTGSLFVAWARQSLAPALKPGDVVVMDNLNCHKVAGVEEAIEAAGASVWYLPPYSPDLNPIEKAWSKVKAFLRDHESVCRRNLRR
jgi:hypothetical protein